MFKYCVKHKFKCLFALTCLFLFFEALSFKRLGPNSCTTVNPSPGVRGELEEYRVWFESCSYVLLDLGANRGDTILRWSTEQTYSGRAKVSQIDKIYDFEERKKFCILSFEPNAAFDSALLGIEEQLNKEGYKVKVKLHTAVSDRFAQSVIYLDDASTYAYGTSLVLTKKVNFEGKLHSLGREQPVQLVDLVSILKCIPKKVQLVVKMDIEGGEYDILRSLIPSGLVCSIDVLMIEYHLHKMGVAKKSIPPGVNEVFGWLLESSQCGVRIILDD